MSSVPVPAGLSASSVIGDTTTTEVAAVEPNITVVPFVKLVPLIVTTVPPPSGPASGQAPRPGTWSWK